MGEGQGQGEAQRVGGREGGRLLWVVAEGIPCKGWEEEVKFHLNS